MDVGQETTDVAANKDGRSDDAEEDLMARFPNLEELTMPNASDLPEPPKPDFKRPNLRRDTDPLPEGTKSVLANVGRSSRNLRSMGIASTVGISLAVSIGVGTGLGWLADKYLIHPQQTPWGLIVGFMVGVTTGFINLVRVTNQLNQDSE